MHLNLYGNSRVGLVASAPPEMEEVRSSNPAGAGVDMDMEMAADMDMDMAMVRCMDMDEWKYGQYPP